MPFFPCHYPVSGVPRPGDKQMGLAGAELSPIGHSVPPWHDHQPSAGRHDISAYSLSVRSLTVMVGISQLVLTHHNLRALYFRHHYCIYIWECASCSLLCEQLITVQLVMCNWLWINSTCLYLSSMYKWNLTSHNLLYMKCRTRSGYIVGNAKTAW